MLAVGNQFPKIRSILLKRKEKKTHNTKKEKNHNTVALNPRAGLLFSTQICCIISSTQVFALACLMIPAVPSWFIFQLRSGQLVRPGDRLLLHCSV